MTHPSDLADLEQRLRERLERTPVASTLGVELVSIGPESAVLRLPHRIEVTNGNGVVHGGILASLADSAVAFALATAFDGKMGFATSDLTIHYLRRARGEVVARARIVRRGGTVALGEAELFDGEGTLLAKALVSYILTTVRLSPGATAGPLRSARDGIGPKRPASRLRRKPSRSMPAGESRGFATPRAAGATGQARGASVRRKPKSPRT